VKLSYKLLKVNNSFMFGLRIGQASKPSTHYTYISST
jgi:hypothetical protein